MIVMHTVHDVSVTGPSTAVSTPSQVERFNWLAVGLLCALVAYLTVEQRGLYQDDYYWRVENRIMFPARYGQEILAPFLIRRLALTHELLLHLFLVSLVLANALLASHLVRRALGRGLAAVTVFWMCLVPFVAHEAVLWTNATMHMLPGTFMSLLCLHAFYTGLTGPARRLVWFVSSAVAFFASLAFSETMCAGLVVAIVMLSLLEWSEGRRDWNSITYAACSLLMILVIALAVYWMLYKGNPAFEAQVALRQSTLTFQPLVWLGRSPVFLRRFLWMTLSADWGLPLLAEASVAGLMAIWTRPLSVVLAALALGLMILTVWRAPRMRSESPSTLKPLIVVGGSLIWFVVALLVPGIFLTAQILEYRMIYFPFVGFATMCGALLQLIAGTIRAASANKVVTRTVMSLAALFLFFGTTVICGFTDAYARRYIKDQQQLSATVGGLNINHLPQDTVLVPYNLDESTFSGAPALDRMLSGMFETPWAARAGIRIVTGRADITFVTMSRWVPMSFAPSPSPQGDALDDHLMAIQGIPVSLDKLLVYTVKNNEVLVYNAIKKGSAGHTQRVTLPLHPVLGPNVSIRELEIIGGQ